MTTAHNTERAVAERQASVALSRLLGRIALEAGDKIAISVHVSTPNGGTVTDRAVFIIPEPLRK